MKTTAVLARLLAVLVVGFSTTAVATSPGSADTRVQSLLSNLPLYFVENRGQEDPRVAYYVPGQNITTYFTAEGVTFAFSSPASPSRPRQALLAPEPVKRERWALKLDFVGARPVMPRGQDVTPTIFSYFKGPESEWKTGLRTYASVVYPELWPGIDLVYEGSGGRLKYAFHVKPGSDPNKIKLAYRGATSVVLDRGRLEVATPLGGFTDDRPYAYQEAEGRRIEVPARYAKTAGEHAYGFQVGEYDRSRPLVLDPGFFVYSGVIGGGDADQAFGIAVDSSGNAYVAGEARSTAPSFPATVGPDLSFNGGLKDAFVAKVRADGTGFVYLGYIGGGGIDSATAVAVDAAGNAYVAGITSSSDFPAIRGPGLTHNGGGDAFVTKVNAAGTGLVYSGFIGGAGDDVATGIAVDGAGNAYVAGRTSSDEASFLPKVGPGLTFNGGTTDAFVAKVKSDGTGFVYLGYIGGAGDDVANAIAIDASGRAYVAGTTNSDETSFLPKVGPDLSFNGASSATTDAFVAKVKADGSGLVYLGYIGGAGDDQAHGIAVDSGGNAYVVGETTSDEVTFPVKMGPDLVFNGGVDAFVAKIKADGTGLVYAGYIGGTADDVARGVRVDAAGNAYVTGFTSSTTGFPIRVGPDLTYNGGTLDVFLAKVKADGTSLLYAGYIGGWNRDSGFGLAIDSDGNAYVAGVTTSEPSQSPAFPLLVGPDLTFGSATEAFVVKVSGKPDLQEGALTIPSVVKPGGSFLVTSAVVNNGLGTAPPTTTRYYLSADDQKSDGDIRLSGSKSVSSLNPGAVATGSVTVTVPTSTPLGSYLVLACADDLQAVAELDESVNCGPSFSAIQVTLPDLRETAVSNPPASRNAGQSFSVTDTVQNFGSVAAGSSTTRYYLSTDTAKDDGDRRLTGTRSVPTLNSGQSSTGTVSVTIPSTTPAGTYHLLACADDTGSVSETNENNNCRASTGTMAVSGTGTFELSPTAATVLPDQLVLYRLTWITPTVWTDLASLDLRFVGASDGKVIFWVRWDQASNTFTLVDTDGTATGRPAAPGSSEILQTGNAVLHLDQTTVVPGGPTAPDVTLTLAMTFKSEAAGQAQTDYRVEVNATDDFGRAQGFAQGGTLRVERTAPASASLTGSASGVASGTDNGSIRLQGQFTATETVALNEATLTLTGLLEEVRGAGELTRGTGSAAVLPLTLAEGAGGKATDAIYQTPSGVRPIVWAEIKVRDASTGLMEFYIKVDRATILGPALCAGASPSTQLRTSFSLQAAGTSVAVDLTQPWRCLGSELKTP
jgi:hypothetical protein